MKWSLEPRSGSRQTRASAFPHRSVLLLLFMLITKPSKAEVLFWLSRQKSHKSTYRPHESCFFSLGSIWWDLVFVGLIVVNSDGSALLSKISVAQKTVFLPACHGQSLTIKQYAVQARKKLTWQSEEVTATNSLLKPLSYYNYWYLLKDLINIIDSHLCLDLLKPGKTSS